jgi:hypothetical protein
MHGSMLENLIFLSSVQHKEKPVALGQHQEEFSSADMHISTLTHEITLFIHKLLGVPQAF